MARHALLALLVGLGGCGDAALPPLTNAVALACPRPGALPFRLESTGFARRDNAALAQSRTRDKDEAADTLGNPHGATADSYLADAAAAPGGYRGLKARTAETNGLFSTPLPGERVSLWTYDDQAAAWAMIDRGETGEDGMYDFPDEGDPPANGQPVYAMLEADGSCAVHYRQLLPPGTKVVVTDIDGTLTTADSELFEETADPTYLPRMKVSADALMRAWASKRYQIVYLTARPHVYRAETREWLRALGFPIGAVITANDLSDASAYKTRWLQRLTTSFGWTPVAVYGNAETDISAYANAGIPKDRTFIIGELAGSDGTVPIFDDDYTAHIASFVDAQPDNAP